MTTKINEEKILTLSDMAKYLNEVFSCKKTGQPFTAQDVQQYIRFGHLPSYLGGNEIIEFDNQFNVKLYKIKKSESIRS